MRRRAVGLLGALALASGLAFGAADLAAPTLGESHPAALVANAALAPTCHQRADRSFVLGGVPLGACARCTGLHASALLGGLLVLLLPTGVAAWLPRARLLALAGLAPLLLDVAAGSAFGSWDHPGLRAVTGLFAGCALLLTLRSTETAR